MSINEFLEAVTASLKEAFPGVKSCEVYPGQFTAEELQSASLASPALRLALTDMPVIQEADGGEVDYELALSLAVIVTDSPGLPREKVAAELVEAIARLIAKGATWGTDCAFMPTRPIAQNIYGGDISQLRVQLWEVRWKQTVRLGDPDWQAEGPLPTELYAGQAPKIGQEHEGEYILIRTGEGHAG